MAGYNEGNTFFADARSPLRGGLAGNTVGGDAFIQVKKRYRKDSDVSALRFTYSSASLEVMDFGSGAPPWKAPYAEITMEVDVFQDGVGYVWGLSQTAVARSDLGIDLADLADDIWVLDIGGETRGPKAQVVDRIARWQWDCPTCGEGAYGFHRAKLKAPYTQDVDLSAIPRDARLTLYFALTVRAVDPSQGETAASRLRPRSALGRGAAGRRRQNRHRRPDGARHPPLRRARARRRRLPAGRDAAATLRGRRAARHRSTARSRRRATSSTRRSSRPAPRSSASW